MASETDTYITYIKNTLPRCSPPLPDRSKHDRAIQGDILWLAGVGKKQDCNVIKKKVTTAPR